MSKSTIWQLLKHKGFSDVAAAAIMGNMEAESNCEANRLQGDFTSNRSKSIEYTAQVDNGTISRHNFIYNGPNGGGYGLCQWTYWARKAGLYDLAQEQGASIGDEAVQVDWLVRELFQSEYNSVLQTLQTSDSIRACSDAMLKGFETPADQSDTTCVLRAGYAQNIYDEFAGTEEAETEVRDNTYVEKALLIVMYLKELLQMVDDFEVTE